MSEDGLLQVGGADRSVRRCERALILPASRATRRSEVTDISDQGVGRRGMEKPRPFDRRVKVELSWAWKVLGDNDAG